MATLTRDDIEVKADGTGALQTYLGSTSGDVKTLCTLPSINKWSRNKPLEYNTYELLTSQQRKEGQKYAQGYVWGVKIRGNARLNTIHDFTFDYDKPTTYFRLMDFIGYDKNATADVSGLELSEKIYKDLPGYQYRVNIYIDNNNTTGVSVKNALKDALAMSGAEDSVAFKNIYPVLVLDGKACAMRNTSEHKVTPIYYNNAWQISFEANVQTVLESYAKGTAVRMTIGLVAHEAGSASGIDVSGNWFDCGMIYSDPVFPMPGLVCLNKTVEQYYNDLGCAITSLSGNPTYLYFDFTFENEPDTSVEMVFTANMNGVPASVNYEHKPGTIQIAQRITWRDLGYFGSPKVGTKMTISSATVKFKRPGETQYTNGTGLSNYVVTIVSSV